MTKLQMSHETRRKQPEGLPDTAPSAGGERARKGHLKVFLGYASGVGKSFRMLDEARRRHERGQDVVIGAVQPKVPPDVESLLAGLEVIPLKATGQGTAIDTGALIRRHPAVCIIDGLAYNNPPGAPNPTRWRDVQDLLDAGIKVIGSINIQYIAEVRDQVCAITGKQVTETVPMAFIKSADEIELVDTPPEEPLERSAQEQVESEEREARLARLRELTLVLAAEVVDHQLNSYLESHGITQHFGTSERILVCMTPRANARDMIRTARNIAQRFHGELIAAYVNQFELSPADQAALDEKLALARQAGATIEILEGEDPVKSLIDLARSRGVTQLFIGHTLRSGGWNRFRRDPVDKMIRLATGMDVRVFPQ
jgi:two-component system, OmpR family, sensor histidine kinase KdpD